MGKTRINDLARELEVKSRAILEALQSIGFTERKTHSSAIDDDVAEDVRRFMHGEWRAPSAPATPAAPAAPATPAAPPPPEAPSVSAAPTPNAAPAEPAEAAPAKPKPSPRPAPILRAAPPVEPVVTGPPKAAKMPIAPQRPVYRAPAPDAAPPPPAAKPPAPTVKPAPAVRPAGLTPAPTPEAPRPASPSVLRPAAPVPPTPAPVRPPGRVIRRAQLTVSPSGPSAGSSPATPTPGRRLIVPVAPDRPTYKAPERPLHPVPGKPLVAGPVSGRPIYQRPAPGARVGVRPTGVVPEGRRPMHPTRPGAGRDLPPRGHGRREPRSKEGSQRFQPDRVSAAPTKATVGAITISEGLTVKDLAEKLGLRAKDVIRKLLDRGLMVTVNQTLDTEIASQVAKDFGAIATTVSIDQEAMAAAEPEIPGDAAPEQEKLRPRPPVVTIMGHVDHGKTSLLDAIRLTSVAAGEAGGITQHIGAYKVRISDAASPAFGREIVFIDTPGHAAFTRMRARGAKVTDLVVLVVAADDGVMPQTLEAMDHAKAAGVPVLVAINKIDKPDAQPDRVKKQLADRGLQPEDWGGTTVMVPVSALAKTNLNLLLEMILLVSDLQDLKADPDRPAQGVVLEAQLDRGRGPVARILVQNGTLQSGDNIILGSVFGRVRAMFDDRGQPLAAAGPSTPVEVLGLDGLPDAGEAFVVVNDRSKAKQIAQFREDKARDATLARSSRLNLEALSQQMARGDVKELNLVVKADVQGSEEVLIDTLNKLSTEQVKLRIIHTGVGAITETDVLLASASKAVIIGFNVRPERKAAELAEQENVDIRLHSIIYELTDEIKKAMLGLLEPVTRETTLGHAEVRQVFRIPKAGTIAGCIVKDGKLVRDAQVRIVRDGTVVYTSRLTSLRRFKEDASEVRTGLECGASVANFADIKPGDVLEAFSSEKVAATLA